MVEEEGERDSKKERTTGAKKQLMVDEAACRPAQPARVSKSRDAVTRARASSRERRVSPARRP